MPKSNLDWLGVVSLWVGALIMAIRTGDLSLIVGAPHWLTSQTWDRIPLFLISLYFLVVFYRLIRPEGQSRQITSASKESLAGQAKKREANDARYKVIQQLNSASIRAKAAIGRNNVRESEKEWPTMLAALVSANKQFGIPMPKLGTHPTLNLELARRLIEQCLPLLKSGHDDEAQATAITYLSKFQQGEA